MISRQILLALLALSARLLADPVTVKLDLTARQGTWDGWGASLCWWAAVFGDRTDLADAMFTTKAVQIEGELVAKSTGTVSDDAGRSRPADAGEIDGRLR